MFFFFVDIYFDRLICFEGYGLKIKKKKKMKCKIIGILKFFFL